MHFVPPYIKTVQEEIWQQRSEKMSEAELEGLKNRLEQLMQQQQPYLEPELSLSDLAQRMGLSTSVVSAVMNTGYGKNFNDFVNSYRVERVKALLHDPTYSHLSLLAIGLEAGFNSKATFNRAFKKLTGIAPGDYLKSQMPA
jgi:AraC-like DNA-binding protein